MRITSDYIVSVYLPNKLSFVSINSLFSDFSNCITLHFGCYTETIKKRRIHLGDGNVLKQLNKPLRVFSGFLCALCVSAVNYSWDLLLTLTRDLPLSR